MQGVDSEAAWEAAQKAAAQNTNIAVDFNPYDAETGEHISALRVSALVI